MKVVFRNKPLKSIDPLNCIGQSNLVTPVAIVSKPARCTKRMQRRTMTPRRRGCASAFTQESGSMVTISPFL